MNGCPDCEKLRAALDSLVAAELDRRNAAHALDQGEMNLDAFIDAARRFERALEGGKQALQETV